MDAYSLALAHKRNKLSNAPVRLLALILIDLFLTDANSDIYIFVERFGETANQRIHDLRGLLGQDYFFPARN